MSAYRNMIVRLIAFSLTATGFAWDHGSSSPSAYAANYSAPCAQSKSERMAERQLSEAYGKLPLRFEANEGQTDARVKFISRASGLALFLTADEAVLALSKPGTIAASESVLRMRLVGASTPSSMTGMAELPGKSNYFTGKDAGNWRTNVSAYSRVKYQSVYPGVDMVYYGKQGQLEYDFYLAPGASFRDITVEFEGARAVRIDKSGDLILTAAGGEIRQHRPVVYQEIRQSRKRIAARYVMRGRNRVGFAIARHDASKPLVIDPVLSYSTYLGGSSVDTGRAIAVDASGNAYVTGSTRSTNFPTVGSQKPFEDSSLDVFVTKLNSAGTAILYSTFIRGEQDNFFFFGDDEGLGLAVDSAGDAYVTGQTNSTRFPTTPGAFQTVRGGDPLERFLDGFVLKLNSTGSSLIYSSYLGGKFDDVARAVAVDSAGNAYITGSTQSPDFPAANASQGGLSRAFVTKVNPAGSALLYSMRIGGSGDETASAIAIDAAGSAYVTGSTTSSDFPAVNAYQQTFSGKSAFKSNTGGGSWGAINNDLPPGDGVRSLAVDPHNSSTIYAGTDSRGIFKSTTGGASWAAINSGIADLASIGFPNLFDRVTDLAIDPANPNIIYAAMFGPALYKSTNGGGSWSLLDTRLVNAIAIDPTNSSRVYTVDSVYGLSTSTDGGSSWDIGGGGVNPAFNCRALAVAPTNPPSIYIGSSGRGAFRVGGGFFFPAAVQVISLAVDPATPSTVYAGTFVSGVYKTTNGGNAWSPASAGMSAANTTAVTVFSLAVDPANPSTIYAGTSVGVFKSTDGGGNWGPINAGLPNRVVNEIAVDPSNTSTLYAGAAATSDIFAAKLSPSGSAIVFSTYFGGASVENGSGIAVDAAGGVYVTGATTSTGLAANPLRPFSGGSDAFVVKFNPATGALVYFTYVGGSNNDQGNGIAVDASGAAYVVGTTFSADYPTTPGALPIPPLGACPNATCTHGFLTKLNSAGSALLYSTYLGGVSGEPNSNGIGKDNGNAIAVDSTGGVYVTGLTIATDFPITPGAFDATYNGSVDAFVSKISITPFDACIQDDRNGNLLQINLTTGDYQFSNCRKNFLLTGRGAVRIRSCKIEFRASAPDRSISALANSCTLKGDATIEVFSQGQTYTIADANTSDNTCACSR